MTKTKTELPAIFKECTGSEQTKYVMPFIRSGYHYATDGAIIVRLATDKSDTSGDYLEPGTLPWDAALYGSTPVALTGMQLSSRCSHCDDGRVYCSECGQTAKCQKCHGTGANYMSVDIQPGTAFYGLYLERLHRYAVRLYPPKKDRSRSPWRFEMDDGVEGLVMPRIRGAEECVTPPRT